ncbi:MAG: pilus assembly protein PilM [Bifidobacteriaceae bacterium]|nr:pilus assembly protein PilM [Bifidobacteriaceae bacterium]
MTTAVGLDLGAAYARAAVVEYDAANPLASPPRIVEFAQVSLDAAAMADGEVANAPLVADAVRHLFTSKRLPTKNVVLGCGGGHVTVREIELPVAPMDQLRASLAYMVQDELSVRVEDCLLDFYPIRVTDQRVHGLLVAALAESVNRMVSAVSQAGIIPVRVDLAACGIARMAAGGPYGEGVVGVVNMGASATDVMVLVDGVPQVLRTLPYGGELITESVMRACSVPRDEAERVKLALGLTTPPVGDESAEAAGAQISRRVQAVVESIGQTFSYHAQRTGQQVAGVLVSGRAALMPGLDRYLHTNLRLPMARLAVDQLVSVSPTVASHLDDGVRSDLAVAAGLAFGGAPANPALTRTRSPFRRVTPADAGPAEGSARSLDARPGVVGAPSLPGVNLLPPAVTERRRLRELRRRLGAGLGAIVLVLAIVMATAVGGRTAAEAELASLRAEQDSLRDARAAFAEVIDVRAEVSRTRDAVITAMGYEVEWVPVIDAILAVLPEGGSLTSIALRATAPSRPAPPNPNVLGAPSIGSVVFTVTVPTLPDAAAWLDSLNAIPGFMDATYTTATLQDIGATDARETDAPPVDRYIISSSVQLNIVALARDFEMVITPEEES